MLKVKKVSIGHALICDALYCLENTIQMYKRNLNDFKFKILGNHDKKILVLHGLFGSLDNWLSIAKELSKYIQVHIIDLRNHGKSFHEKSFL